MKDPVRLSKTLDAHGRSVLAAVDEDGPAAGSKDALLATLGLATSTAAGVGAGALAAKGAKVAAVASWWTAPLAKVALAVGIGTVAASSALALRNASNPPKPPEPRVAAPVVTGREVTSASPARAEVAVDVVMLPTAPTPVAKPVRARAPRSAIETATPPDSPAPARAERVEPEAPRPRSTVRDELTLLDDARALLVSGQGRAALVRLDEHRQRYPNGTLSHEATTMRVDALMALGRRDEAGSIAKAFLAANPDSAHAPRIRKMIESTTIR